jgi:hypothetical protein
MRVHYLYMRLKPETARIILMMFSNKEITLFPLTQLAVVK